MGVSVHINYDLVFVVGDMLRASWAGLADEQRQDHYTDYNTVNAVIGNTITWVIRTILIPEQPLLTVIDLLPGRLDERAVLALVTNWREQTWQSAIRLTEHPHPDAQAYYRRQVEMSAVERSQRTLLRR